MVTAQCATLIAPYELANGLGAKGGVVWEPELSEMDSVAHVIEALPRFDPAKATFDAKALSPADVIDSIEQFGCAWLKGLFDPTELERFDAVMLPTSTVSRRSIVISASATTSI